MFQQKKWRGPATLLLDRVHEHVSLHPIIKAAINTPAFQRLRNCRQLGASSFLYPGANHTRFEHSIGVQHLATMWLSLLEEKSCVEVTAEEKIEVALAGLCHDLGHGPFSHLFESSIVPRLRSAEQKFVHEDMSVKLTNLVVQDELGLGRDTAERISGMITGKSNCPKKFLGHIVSNPVSIIDVDKLDYYQRDSLSCFGRSVSEVRPKRFFWGTAVNDDGEIVFEQKTAVTLRELTSLRARLHRSVYQHPTTLRVGRMIGDIIGTAAEEDPALGDLIVRGATGDVDAFLRLSDWIFDAIRAGAAYPKAVKARALAERLDRRELYPMLGIVKLNATERFSSTREELLVEALSRAVAKALGEQCGFGVEDIKKSIILERVVVHHGRKNEDPLRLVKFFSPKVSGSRPNSATTLEEQLRISDVMTPAVFQEQELVAMTRMMPGSPVAVELKRRFAEVSRDVGLSQTTLPTTN